MSLSEKMVEINNEVVSLLNYANGVTSVSDTNLGEAVRRLGAGYGGGGDDAVFTKARIIGYDINASDWHIDRFNLPTDRDSGYITVEHTLGVVPTSFIVIPASNQIEDFFVKYCYGGYNFGNTLDDANNNRTLQITYTPNDTTPLRKNFGYTQTLYNLSNTSCPSNATSQYAYLRTGGGTQTKWKSGDYYLLTSSTV